MNKWDERLIVKAIYILTTIFCVCVKVYLGSMYCRVLVPLDASNNLCIVCINMNIYFV